MAQSIAAVLLPSYGLYGSHEMHGELIFGKIQLDY